MPLLRHPAELAQLRSHPEQIPKAIGEILRYACLPQSVFRHALQPVALCGLRIAGGGRVILRLASANRDPLQFSDPDRLDFARRGAAHLSLGFGPHSCVGGALIRMSASVATRVFVERFGGSEICGPVEWQGGSGFRSPATLRVHQGPGGSFGMLRSESMAGHGANTDPKIAECVEELKSKIPAADHASLESRLQALINDPDADDNDVISILRQEFDPEKR